MPQVLVGVGSNINPKQHLIQAAKSLKSQFDSVVFASVYRSAAVGMEAGEFLNTCCLFFTHLSLLDTRLQLKELEDKQGRDRSQGSWQPRTLDLDILIYDGNVIDDELYRHAHAFVPAGELVDMDLPTDIYALTTKVSLQL